MKPETVQEMLNLLHSMSIDELDMLDYLVEWARIKYASEAFTPARLSLAKAIDNMYNFLGESASLQEVELSHSIDEHTFVYADAKMLTSILQNIISNAIKYTNKKGQIHISSACVDKMIRIEIKDTGIGMSEELLKILFTPQMKSLIETRKVDKGAGIGLLLVKGFLEKSGGEIWVQSVEGLGTSFFITLPSEKAKFKVGSSEESMFDESI